MNTNSIYYKLEIIQTIDGLCRNKCSQKINFLKALLDYLKKKKRIKIIIKILQTKKQILKKLRRIIKITEKKESLKIII